MARSSLRLHHQCGDKKSILNLQEIHTVDGASEKIKNLIIAEEMPEDIGKLGAEYVAVRSSATAEDSGEAAWAGQLDSFLNTTEEDVLNKVKHCWASLFTPRAIFYRFEKDLHKTKISVAVVIQKMVESEVSGIAFSVHPVTEDYNQLIIEAGLASVKRLSPVRLPPIHMLSRKSRAGSSIKMFPNRRGVSIDSFARMCE